ncbi:MFS general substrate transporter [Xylariaceae sp. FL0662B]|nr:MFS general substrate transporter [Xylariaceae sp. FL0662B]
MAGTVADSNGGVSASSETKEQGLRIGRAEGADPDNGEPMITGTEEDGEDAATKRKKPLGFYLSFLAINILVFVCALDATTLAVAIPSIAAELDGSTLESFWASIAYYLGTVVAIPLYASVSNVFGRKSPLHVAFLFFAVGSLVFALARNMGAIIAGRVLQGLGGGGLDVLGEIIVSDMTSLSERPLYLGIMALPIAIGSIIGPTVGALFSDFVTWRWIGWINLPLLGVSFPLLLFFLSLRSLETSLVDKMTLMDWGGISLFSIGSTVFVLPLSWADSLYPWNSWQTILPLLIGAAVLVGFAVYESKPEAPVVPHRLFHSRTMIVSLCGGFIHGMTLFTLLQYLPLFYQAVMLDSRIGSAVTLLPTSVICVVAAIISVIAIGYRGSGYGWRIWASWVLVTLGTGLLLLLDSSSSSAMRHGLPVIWGAGVGALLRLLHLPVQASVPTVDDTGAAICLLLTFRIFGGLIGLAIGSTIFNSVFGSSIAAIGELPDSLASLRDAHNAISFIPMLRTLDLSPEIIGPVLRVYLMSMRAIFYAMVGFSGLGLVISLFTEELSLDRKELGQQRFEE